MGTLLLSQGVSPVLDLYDGGTLLVTKGASLESIPGEYNIPNVENSTYTNALTEYNDVKSRKKIGENIYDKKSYTDRRGQV